MNRIYQSILSLALVLGLIALYIPVASSVVQNLTVLNTLGEPVRTQTVTIVFPAGVTDADGNTSTEEETDDKGGLYFDFPDDGRYVINFKGGSMTYDVKGGIPTYVWVGGGLLAAGGIYLLADDDDDDNNDGNSSTSSSSTSSSGMSSSTSSSSTSSSGMSSSTSSSGMSSSTSSSGMSSSTSSSGMSSSTSSSGMSSSTSSSGMSSSTSSSSGGQQPLNYDGNFVIDNHTVLFNAANHPVLAILDAILTFAEICTQVLMVNTAFSTNATLTGSCNAGAFNLSGNGTFAGFLTNFLMVGQIAPFGGTFNATVTVGTDGALPEEERIEVSVEGHRTDP